MTKYMNRQPDDPGVHEPSEITRRAYRQQWMLLFVLSAIVSISALWLLAGCTTFNGYRPPVLINGYDPTLTSHQEALGIRP